MKITFVHTSTLLNLRGSEIWLIDVCNLLKNASYSVRVINFDYDKRYPKTRDEAIRRYRIVGAAFGNIPVVRLSALRMRIPVFKSPIGKALNGFVDTYLHFVPLNRQFFGLLRDSDVIYFLLGQRNPGYLMMVLAACTLAGRRPVIAGVHVQPKITALDLALLKMFAKIGVLKGVHLINKAYELDFHKVGCRTEYIPNGVYYEDFSSSDDQKLSQNKFSILFVGAMTTIKGADMLPEIYSALKKRNFPFTLSICTSGGELTNQMKNWSRDKSDVIFWGFVERNELARLYRESSLALFPSRREAFSIACVEAQASGTPVVVSGASGFRQTVVDGGTGFFASRGDPELFADKITEIYKMWKEDRTRYLAMCSDAQANVRDNFQLKHVLKKLTALFNSVSR